MDAAAAGDATESPRRGTQSLQILEQKVHVLEQEKVQLEMKLGGQFPGLLNKIRRCLIFSFYDWFTAKSSKRSELKSAGDSSSKDDDAKRLKDDINLLRKKLNMADQELQAADVLKRDLEGMPVVM